MLLPVIVPVPSENTQNHVLSNMSLLASGSEAFAIRRSICSLYPVAVGRSHTRTRCRWSGMSAVSQEEVWVLQHRAREPPHRERGWEWD